ncbi:endothelin-converting enzyme Metallo peptidase. MEROPS family M13 [Arsukibacterium tuosuense]|uniref:Endothelin-converting enzyme Metallo peptidase. MEROPS family M13 n=1 Tax=Arsukibacterium tuosuense TaxID=1323745 RepID=A0A285JJ60_9GAMM|nr:M13-type metalloendopeptidase [Arsukibacterium tuosuense]SNY60298.1 endothelin-converting enzyme Metallo peptidase. MEROPS family M13 [Arsukibacterium tuosuense]
MKRISIIAASVALALGLAACSEPADNKTSEPVVAQQQAPRVSGVDSQYFDPAVKFSEDFFLAINGKWLAETDIPADKASYGSFHILNDNSQQAVKAIIDEVSARTDLKEGSDEQKLGHFFNSFMDEATIEKLGLSPLQPQLDAISSLENKQQLPTLFAQLQRDGIAIPFGWFINNDAKNSTEYAVYLNQGGLGLPDRDYYFNDDEKSLKLIADYKAYLTDMFNMAGNADAAAAAERVFALEKALAEHHWTRLDNRNADKTYNKVTVTELNNSMGSFNWAAFANGVKLAEVNDIIVRQPSYFEGFAKVVEATDLQSWQDYLSLKTIHGYADKLSSNFADRRFAFYGTTLSGTEQQQPRWKRAVDASDQVLGELTGKLYVERHFKPEAKARMEELVANLIKAYEISIKELEWMTEDTKVAALDKLSKFTPKIGYPDKWKDYSALEIKEDDLVGNFIRASHWGYDEMVAKLGQPIDKSEWFMTPQTVNAYYNPVNNEIVFPAAILQPPFFNMDADDAVNYGGIGGVIGHEIGHGFDDQGAKYDGDGNLRNWWTEQDKGQFQARGAKLIGQYNKFEPLPGVNVNGAVALGENIGDLGGMTVALKAYNLSLDGKEAPVMDGFSGEQRFFISWAQVWRTKFREEALRRQLSTGPHSPAHYRVIGVLPNIPEFYTAFDIKEGDAMYIAPEQRVKIW